MPTCPRHPLTRHGLSLAALALCAAAPMTALAQAANAVTIYGVIDVGVRNASGLDSAYANSPGSATVVNSGIDTTSRLGYRGSEDLGGGLAAIFNFESGLNVDSGTTANASKFFDRASVVGLRGGWGSVTLGRQTTLLADTNSIVDPLGSRFASFNPNVGIAALSAHRLGLEYGPAGSTTGAFRLDNSIKYNGQFGAFGVSAMHAFGEQTNAATRLSSSGLGLSWRTNALSAAGAWTQMRTSTGLELKAWHSGLTGKLGSGSWALSYAKSDAQTTTSANTRNRTLGLGGTLPLSPSLDLVLTHFDVKRERTAAASDGFRRSVAFLEYKLSRRSMVYAELDHTGWKNGYQGTGNKSTSTGVSAGIKHTF